VLSEVCASGAGDGLLRISAVPRDGFTTMSSLPTWKIIRERVDAKFPRGWIDVSGKGSCVPALA
jgi:hypothetical protein